MQLILGENNYFGSKLIFFFNLQAIMSTFKGGPEFGGHEGGKGAWLIVRLTRDNHPESV